MKDVNNKEIPLESKVRKNYDNINNTYYYTIINEQQGKDVFEYSIFGDTQGQTKIGDFTRGEAS